VDLVLSDPWQRGPVVRRLQDFLNTQAATMGFDRVGADGVYGPETARAVAQLQLRTGRQPNGIFSLRLWEQLIGE
jgi:peptidoglycan hydrolase-like protein with peptidoglycan-binding domain